MLSRPLCARGERHARAAVCRPHQRLPEAAVVGVPLLVQAAILVCGGHGKARGDVCPGLDAQNAFKHMFPAIGGSTCLFFTDLGHSEVHHVSFDKDFEYSLAQIIPCVLCS